MNLLEEVISRSETKCFNRTAVWLIDKCIANIAPVNASDLPDSSIYADGVSGIEEALEEKDYEGALNIAEDTAYEMLYELGYIQNDN
jgi:hypothetical protein